MILLRYVLIAPTTVNHRSLIIQPPGLQKFRHPLLVLEHLTDRKKVVLLRHGLARCVGIEYR